MNGMMVMKMKLNYRLLARRDPPTRATLISFLHGPLQGIACLESTIMGVDVGYPPTEIDTWRDSFIIGYIYMLHTL